MAKRVRDGVKGVEKNRLHQTIRKLTPSLWFMAFALVATGGYVAGLYHYQIEAAIGPVFGYKAHTGNIDLSSVQQTYNVLAANFDGKLDTKSLIEGANRGLVDAAGDKYTVYMSATEAKDYDNSLSGNMGAGIGAEVIQKNGQATIKRVLPDNAAIKAGLQADDIIVKINDQSTAGWSASKVVGQIKGEEGTTVKLSIKRGDTVKDYVITRETINNPSVESSVENGLGIMTISRFDSQTGDQAKEAAQNFKKQGVKGVILDLRDNGGGYVSAATDVAGLWLEDKVVVTERSGGKVKDTDKTGQTAILKGIPTAVLVNGGTASASEIVAGALHDYKVAKLVGEKTFGKGSVQELVPLENSAQIKVTVARWYTPNGVNISKNGIAPDITATYVQKDVDAGADPQMTAAKKSLGY
jgi:carboxyl-terminal processing protease